MMRIGRQLNMKEGSKGYPKIKNDIIILRPIREQERRGKVTEFEGILSTFSKIDVHRIKRGMDRVFDQHQKIRPGFSSSWLIPNPPNNAKLLSKYYVSGSKVSIYHIPTETETLYHILPPEYELSVEYLKLIHLVKAELIEHYPKNLKLDRPEQARTYVAKFSERLLYQFAKRNDVNIGKDRTEEMKNVKMLSEILTKYTAGFAITEIFLLDPNVQDVYIDAPASENLVYVTISGIRSPGVYGRCKTNVILGNADAESMLSRFRYESGRPFSEAMPVLEHDLKMYDTRVTVIGKPLSPDGIAIALRKHSIDPWTLLKFINNKTMTALAAGLISFLIDGHSTMIIAGSRGSGKTSLLGAIMLEFLQSQRILTIEDTLELPCQKMQELGYKVQSIFIQSTLGGKGEMTADEALRVSLRLGESAIVLGEVRGQEAKTLYEAMRTGTAGSSVLGTFHADSAKAVYDRAVSDMGVPERSFTATDIVIVAGLTRPGGTQKQRRKIIQIAEVLKICGEAGAFQDLMAYDENSDTLIETDAFKYKSEKIASIARSWGITLEDAISNIQTRAAYREMMVEYARKNNESKILSAEWVSKSNNAFWNIMEKEARGKKIDHDRVLREWEKWFERSTRYV
jgi:type IV secretory pathway ATPase VirB11/archaellum biosynthesis ATPase